MRVKNIFFPKIFESYLLFRSSNNKLPVESHANAHYGEPHYGEPHRALGVWDSHLLFMGCGADGLNLGWAIQLLCSLGQIAGIANVGAEVRHREQSQHWHSKKQWRLSNYSVNPQEFSWVSQTHRISGPWPLVHAGGSVCLSSCILLVHKAGKARQGEPIWLPAYPGALGWSHPGTELTAPFLNHSCPKQQLNNTTEEIISLARSELALHPNIHGLSATWINHPRVVGSWLCNM